MKQAQLAYFRVCAILPVLFFSAALARAQFSQLDQLAAQLEKEVKPLKPHLVAVADFRSLDGITVPQGHYFAWILSSILQDRAKKNFVVADHVGFDSDLAKLKISTTSLVPGEALQSAAPNLGADVVITGSFEKRENAYFLHVLPVRVADSKSLNAIETKIEITEFLDSFVTPLPEDIHRFNQKNLSVNSTMPRCIHCPDPSYTDLARRNHFQGVAIFEVLITADGRPGQIRPVGLIGNGLDEAGFAAIKKWRFKPATKDGTPVPTIVPIEVTFRLF
jgi:TonB family protein